MSEPAEYEVLVFNAALQLPVRQLEEYLQQACHGDATLRQRVEQLLEAHMQAGEFLEDPVLSTTAVEQARAANCHENLAARETSAEEPGDQIGHYKLLQKIGEGGCGVVYMAEQEEPLRRRVALKIIKLGMDTKSVIARFEAERQALALMEHPGIAKVLDAGTTETGRPYFVMELVRGIRITTFCDQNHLPPCERLTLFIQVCQAVQHAHQKGIIHRDLKPSNILVTVNDGVPVPKVIDFGIAKATQGRLTDKTLFTAFEQVLGTPAYMSPEQSVLTSNDVDTRSDIYSLGALLYELLTGKTPFDQKEMLAAGLEGLLRTLREKEPVVPSTRLRTMLNADLTTVARQRQSEPPRLIHQVRGDLDWIAMKCLEKDRTRRYATANGLAMDVQRYLAKEPIQARPPSSIYRLRKLVQRRRLAFTAAASVLAALVIGLGFSTWQYLEKSDAEREQSRLREDAQKAQASEASSRRQAEAQELAARKKAYASDMNLLQKALAEDNLGRAQELLNRQRPLPGQVDLRGWEWRYFWQFCQSDAAFTLCQRTNAILAVSFSAGGSLVAVGTWDSEISVWDLASRRMIYQRQGQPGASGHLAFDDAGDILAYCDGVDRKSQVVLWDSRTRSETHRLPLNDALRDLAFTRDGRLFTCDWSMSNNVAVWDIKTGRNLARYDSRAPSHGMGTVFNVTADGNRFVHVRHGGAHSVSVVDVADQQHSTFQVTDELTTAVAFSPDGGTLITGAGYADGTLKLWDVPHGQSVGELVGHRSWVSSLKLLPDGTTLASASADRTIRLWNLATRQAIRTLRGQNHELWTIDVSPDGRWLVSGSKDGSVVIWDLNSTATRPPAYRTLRPGGTWYGDSYSPDGRWFGFVQQGRVQLYDAATLRPASDAVPALTNLLSFAFAPDMRVLAVTGMKGQLDKWELPGHRLITNLVSKPATNSMVLAGFIADANSLLTYGIDRVIREWDALTGNELRHWPLDVDKTLRVVSPTAEMIAVANGNGWVELISLRGPDERRRFRCQSRLIGIDLSPDGKVFTAASENGTVELWDTETLTRSALLRGALLGYHSVAISPDGTRLVAGSNGEEAIKLWDLDSQEEVATLAGHGSFFSQLKISPDGKSISAKNWNGVIHFWTAPSWEDIAAAETPAR
jgi:eukaryotic-like serine/threonine-protein kinase